MLKMNNWLYVIKINCYIFNNEISYNFPDIIQKLHI